PEMIQADEIDMRQPCTQAVQPPTVAGSAQCIPIINRIAPELPRSAEVVGGNTGDKAWPMLLIEQKELRICPDVAAVRRNEEWQVAEQVHSFGAGMFPDPPSLPQ